jgi:hypothetical protein
MRETLPRDLIEKIRKEAESGDHERAIKALAYLCKPTGRKKANPKPKEQDHGNRDKETQGQEREEAQA